MSPFLKLKLFVLNILFIMAFGTLCLASGYIARPYIPLKPLNTQPATVRQLEKESYNMDDILKQISFSKQLGCLGDMIYGECSICEDEEQLKVAQVARNRLSQALKNNKNADFCDVVYAPSQFESMERLRKGDYYKSDHYKKALAIAYVAMTKDVYKFQCGPVENFARLDYERVKQQTWTHNPDCVEPGPTLHAFFIPRGARLS